MATVTVIADVELDEFDDDDLVEEIKERGLQERFGYGEGESGLPSHIERRLATLVLCGQHAAALEDLIAYMTPFIGRIRI